MRLEISTKKCFELMQNHDAFEFVKKHQKNGEKVVFTNGCFDILHRGHVELLKKARELGDVLIVAINSDDSVKRLKGEKRPINNVYDRAYVLNALKYVDAVTYFEEDTPYEILKALRPDVLVKGGDYKPVEVVGRDIVEKVVIIPFVKGYSTTKTINKVVPR